MDNPGEIMRFCRLCLVKDQVNIPIFEEQGDIRQIFLKISSCLPVKVSREDKLPKKICDGCSNKLDLLYEFWNTSANAEKTLLSWLGQAGVKDVDQTITAVAQQIAKPSEPQVKEETPEDGHAAVQNTDHLGISNSAVLDDSSAKDETEEPPPKRARRTAAVKAQINLTPDSEEEDDDLDTAEPMTKIEDESDESDNDDKDPSYVDVPGTSADDQPGPSGVGKDGAEAPSQSIIEDNNKEDMLNLINGMKRDSDDRLEFSFEDSDSTDYVDIKITNVTFFCQRCDEQFKSETELQYHTDKKVCKLSSDNIKGKYCNICDKRFKGNKFLRIHVKKFHERPKIRITCCTKTYVNEEKYEAHKKKYHNEQLNRLPNGLYLCKYCSKTFQSFQSITAHINTYHTKETSYLCNICGKKFYSIIVLRHHTKRHEQDDAMKIKVVFACPFCTREFTTSESLEAHITTSHTKHYDRMEDGKFKCKLCEKTFVARISIEDHLDAAHLQSKMFLCDHCGRNFFNQNSLKRHEVSHIEERNFQCSTCFKLFKNANSLKSHQNKKHPSFFKSKTPESSENTDSIDNLRSIIEPSSVESSSELTEDSEEIAFELDLTKDFYEAAAHNSKDENIEEIILYEVQPSYFT
ncbi:zinc finger protein 652-B-like isoform X8 [Sitophilus oryzae]|uniref:Zinc finger protein 652-B-like isoform X8 n=1 Tax=Sitophilus oryzae TaxID=7048 RepID=A0A6J2XPJ4_SITOR|nr:zinc finger protein 652-B-like isoform X8 [Sitophilus oryzae]